MTRKLNLLNHTNHERRVRFLKDHPEVLTRTPFYKEPNPGSERYQVSKTPNGCTITQYKWTVTVDIAGVPGLPQDVEMEEVVMSTADLEEDE